MNSAAARWLPSLSATPAKTLRLFCFPFAGGSAGIFRPWVQDLTRIEVCPVQLPGRGSRIAERPFERMHSLLPALADAMQDCVDSPFAFFGHSLGGLIAFELACYLRSVYGVQPKHLFVSGMRPAHLINCTSPKHLLPDAEFIASIAKLNGMPQEVLSNRELMQLALPALRSDFALYETYRYQDRRALSCDMTVFGGASDPEVPLCSLNGWRLHTTGSFTTHILPGDHFFLNSSRSQLVRLVSEALSL